MRKSRYGLAAALTGLSLFVSSLVPAAAQAYDNSQLDATQIRVSTDNCPCSYPDSADGTTFQEDAGGVAIKIEWRYPGRGLVAKAEFHPYGEVLWVYDTENDSDTIYVGLENATTGGFYGPYSATGTSNAVDYTKVNLSFNEGDVIYLHFYDGNYTDTIASFGWGRA